MPDKQHPKKVFYGELKEGKRSQGGQKKRYEDTLKDSLKDFDIQWGLGNRLHRSDQSGEVSSTKEQLSMKKKRESVKLKENAENAMPIPMGHKLIP